MVSTKRLPLVFRLPRLAAASLLRLATLPRRLGVRMLGARRQRRVLRRLAFDLPFEFLDPRFQLGNPRQQQANDRLGFRRLAGNQFFRDKRFHAHCCDMKRPFKSRSVSCRRNTTSL
jgi:hypothetical protein